MYLVSRHAGWGRSFWINVDDGTVDTHTRGEHWHIKVQNGFIVEKTSREKDECTTLRYGQERKTKKGNKTIEEEYFQPGTLQAIRKGGLWKRQTRIPLCGSKGTLECFSTSGGAYGKEIFKYDNGVQAYIATRWRKNLQVRRPNGKLWMVIQGKVALNRTSLAERLDPKAIDLGLCYGMRGSDWEFTVYDTSGVKMVTQGHMKNHQKQGKWLERGKETYYISGVQVSRQIYEGDPNKWDGYDVLRIPNAQLRCSLLNRMGYNRLLEKVNGKVIDTSADGGQLLEVDTQTADNLHGVDRLMRMVKVICPSTGQTYVLRVPPAIANYDQARQWTFGLREASIREGAHLDLVKET
jgi:hypothetical protein